jgi:hypothetical protein
VSIKIDLAQSQRFMVGRQRDDGSEVLLCVPMFRVTKMVTRLRARQFTPSIANGV